MKHYFKNALIVALATSGILSCSQENGDENSRPAGKVRLNIQTNSLATRTSFGDKEDRFYPGLWTDGEAATVYMSYTEGSQTVAGTVSTVDQKLARIVAEMDLVEGSSDFTYYAVVPASTYRSFDAASGIRFEVPAEQCPSATTFDPAASVLVGKSELFPEQQGDKGDGKASSEQIDMTFDFAVAYGRMNLLNLAKGELETVVSVAFEASGVAIAGTADFLDGNVSVNNGSETITVVTSALSDIWFTSLPATLSDGNWSISVTTSAGTYKRTIADSGKSLELAKGVVAEFSVDMSGAVFTPNQVVGYTKQINAGDAECTFGGDGGIILQDGFIKGINYWRPDGHLTVTFSDVPASGVYTLKIGCGIWPYPTAPDHVFNFHVSVNGGTATNHTIPQPAEDVTLEEVEYTCEVALQAGTNTITINGGDKGYIDGFAPHFKYFIVTNESGETPVVTNNFPGSGAIAADLGTF